MASAAEQIGRLAAFVLLLVGLVTVTDVVSGWVMNALTAARRRIRARRDRRKLRGYEIHFLATEEYEQLWGES